MRQIWAPKSGKPGVLHVQDAPDPVPRSGEVRVRVAASGVSMIDVLARAGLAREVVNPPFVPGFEVAGVVDMVAQGVTGIQEGDHVIAMTHLGGYADLVCVPYRQVYRRHEWMSAEDGAAIPVDYLTAYLALVVVGSVRKGSKVFIHAAHGGPGLAALHICRILGAEVYGTAPANHHEFLQGEGLQAAIDHAADEYEEAALELSAGRGFEVIVNPYGGVHQAKNFRLLRPAGRLIHLAHCSGVTGRPSNLSARLQRLLGAVAHTPQQLMHENKGVIGLRLDRLWTDVETVAGPMSQLLQWYDEALFRPCIDRVIPFEQASDAHTHVEMERNAGKVLLRP